MSRARLFSRLAQVVLLTALAMLVLGFTGLDGWRIYAAAALLVALGVRYLRPIGYRRHAGPVTRPQTHQQ